MEACESFSREATAIGSDLDAVRHVVEKACGGLTVSCAGVTWQVLAGGGVGEEERNPLLVKAGEAVLHSMVQRMVLPKIR